jgi:hypothetical protein
METLLGGIFGGVLRLAPEALKFFDAKNERKHELSMLEAEMKFAQVKAEAEMRKTEAQMVRRSRSRQRRQNLPVGLLPRFPLWCARW